MTLLLVFMPKLFLVMLYKAMQKCAYIWLLKWAIVDTASAIMSKQLCIAQQHALTHFTVT